MKRTLAPFVLAVAGSCSREPTPTSVSLPAAASLTPSDRLDGLDTRTPVPLLPQMAHHQKQNMRDHLVAVQEIIAGLAAREFEGIEEAASRIGFSEQMGQMCSHMGAGAPGFSEHAITFHQTADRIVAAARARDVDRVLSEFNATLQTCTACHATWKQQVVDDVTWQRIAALSPSHAP